MKGRSRFSHRYKAATTQIKPMTAPPEVTNLFPPLCTVALAEALELVPVAPEDDVPDAPTTVTLVIVLTNVGLPVAVRIELGIDSVGTVIVELITVGTTLVAVELITGPPGVVPVTIVVEIEETVETETMEVESGPPGLEGVEVRVAVAEAMVETTVRGMVKFAL